MAKYTKAPRGAQGESGWKYWASLYCPEHAAALPDIDPEGNEKSPVFWSDEAGARSFCAEDTCDLQLDVDFYRCDLTDAYPEHFADCDGGDVCEWTPPEG